MLKIDCTQVVIVYPFYHYGAYKGGGEKYTSQLSGASGTFGTGIVSHVGRCFGRGLPHGDRGGLRSNAPAHARSACVLDQ